MQVADAIATFAQHLPGITVVPVYGGSPFLPQQRALQRGAQVVVGTPGSSDRPPRARVARPRPRPLHGARRGRRDAPDGLCRGCRQDPLARAPEVVRSLCSRPRCRPRSAVSRTTTWSHPVEVTVARQSSTVTTVRQTYAVVPHRHKVGALARVLAVSDADAAIVFVRTRDAAEEVGSALVERGVSAAFISGRRRSERPREDRRAAAQRRGRRARRDRRRRARPGRRAPRARRELRRPE